MLIRRLATLRIVVLLAWSLAVISSRLVPSILVAIFSPSALVLLTASTIIATIRRWTLFVPFVVLLVVRPTITFVATLIVAAVVATPLVVAFLIITTQIVATMIAASLIVAALVITTRIVASLIVSTLIVATLIVATLIVAA